MAIFSRVVIPLKITLIIFTITLIFSPSLISSAFTPKKFKKIYAFGDSYTDTGNTHSATGPSSFNYVSNPPYGNTFFHHPTNRYSDGRLVIDFVAESLSLPFLPPYRDLKADKTYGVNFAVAGSTAIRHRFFVKNNITLNVTPQSLQTQLTWFNRFLESKGCVNSTSTPQQCEALFSDALFWVGEIGANDYAYSFASTVSPNTIQRLATRSFTGFLQVISTIINISNHISIQFSSATMHPSMNFSHLNVAPTKRKFKFVLVFIHSFCTSLIVGLFVHFVLLRTLSMSTSHRTVV